MSTFISLYLFVAISVLVLRALLKRLPGVLAIVLSAPVAPFVLAWQYRKKSPATAWTLFLIWLAFFLLVAFMVIAID